MQFVACTLLPKRLRKTCWQYQLSHIIYLPLTQFILEFYHVQYGSTQWWHDFIHVSFYSPLEFRTGHMGLSKVEWVLLISPWLSSCRISLWMEPTSLDWCRHQHIVMAAIGTCCSLTDSNSYVTVIYIYIYI